MSNVPFGCNGCGCHYDLGSRAANLNCIFCPNCGKPARERRKRSKASFLKSAGSYGHTRSQGYAQSESVRPAAKLRVAPPGRKAVTPDASTATPQTADTPQRKLRLPAPPSTLAAAGRTLGGGARVPPVLRIAKPSRPLD